MSFQSDLELRVPKSIPVITRNCYGKTTITGLTGDTDVTGQNGAVERQRLTGKVRAETAYAALTNLLVKTSCGSMEIRLPAGLKPAVQARTTYGTHKSDFPLLPKSQTSFADVPAGTPRITLENRTANIRVVRE